MSIVLLLLLSGSPQNAPRATYVITEAGRIQPEAGGSLALLPTGDATIVIRNEAADTRTLLLPLHSTDLNPLPGGQLHATSKRSKRAVRFDERLLRQFVRQIHVCHQPEHEASNGSFVAFDNLTKRVFVTCGGGCN